MTKNYLDILCKDLKQTYDNYKKQVGLDNTDINYYGNYYTTIIKQVDKNVLFYIESATDLLDLKDKFENIVYICKHPSLINGVLVPTTDFDSEIGRFEFTYEYFEDVCKKFGVSRSEI